MSGLIDPQALYSEAGCFICFGSISQAQALELALLARIAGGKPGTVPTSFDISDASTSGNTILTWTQNGNTSVQVWQSISGGPFTLLATVPANNNTFTDTTAMADGQQFTYKLAGVIGTPSAFTNTLSVSQNLAPATVTLPDLVLEYKNLTLTASAGTAVSAPLLRHVGFSVIGHGVAAFTSVSFPVLLTVGLNFDFSTCSGLTSVSASVMTSVTQDLLLNTCGALTSITFTALQTVGRNLFFFNSTTLATIVLANMTSVGGVFSTDQMPALTTLTLTNLGQAGTISICNGVAPTTGLATISLPALTQMNTGAITATHMTNLTTISIPNLVNSFDLQFHDNASLTSVALTAFSTAMGTGVVSFANCTSLTTLNLSNWVGSPGNFDCSGSTLLANLTLTHWAPSDNGQTVTMNGCALVVGTTTTGVDGVLRRCQASLVTTLTINLAGGTNATPNAAGQTDKTSLITAGNSVTTN